MLENTGINMLDIEIFLKFKVVNFKMLPNPFEFFFKKGLTNIFINQYF